MNNTKPKMNNTKHELLHNMRQLIPILHSGTNVVKFYDIKNIKMNGGNY